MDFKKIEDFVALTIDYERYQEIRRRVRAAQLRRLLANGVTEPDDLRFDTVDAFLAYADAVAMTISKDFSSGARKKLG